MGYREDVMVIYSKEGWDDLIAKIGSSLITDQEREWAVDMINEAEVHQTNSDGDHLLVFESIKSYADDAQVLLNKLNHAMDSSMWMVQTLGEDGAEEVDGGYFDHSFSPWVSRQLQWNTGDDVVSTLDIADFPKQAPTPEPMIAVDDHTCSSCGNTKCSKREKSCWKCGASI